MRKQHYVDFLESRFEVVVSRANEDDVVEGYLVDRASKKRYPILNSIPRIVDSTENYADTFGFQWSNFKDVQLDGHTKLKLSKERFYSNTHWKPGELNGKLVLEVGCGAGRFTEILLNAGAKVVSFDYSNAVEANYKTNGHHPDLFIFQGSLYDIPFPNEHFDFVFCYGVLQHTPDPPLGLQSVFSKLKRNGKISIDYYLTPEKPTVWATPKYFWRPFTVTLRPTVLLRIIRIYMPFWLPLDTLIKRLPYHLGYRILSRVPIPCYNYLDSGLNYGQRLQWAILDTFDALSAKYDYPRTRPEFERMVASLKNSNQEIVIGSNGLVANMVKD